MRSVMLDARTFRLLEATRTTLAEQDEVWAGMDDNALIREALLQLNKAVQTDAEDSVVGKERTE